MITKKEGEVAYYCLNPACYAQSKEKIRYFAAKNAVDIPGLGDKIVERLLDEGLISDAADLYVLEPGDLSGLENFGEISANNLVESIRSRRKLELDRFLNALGIRHVGEETSVDLARHFESIEAIRKATPEQLAEISNIGQAVAESVASYFSDSKNSDLVNRLLKEIEIVSTTVTQIGSLSGKTFVLTGSLENFTRDSAKVEIRCLGGSVSDSISRKTDYLISGRDPGSKEAKAKKLGIEILNEKAFSDILNKR